MLRGARATCAFVRVLVWRITRWTARIVERRLGPYDVFRSAGHPRVVIAQAGVPAHTKKTVIAALRVIWRVDEIRYRRIVRDLDAIVVVDLGAPSNLQAWYTPGSRRCYIPGSTIIENGELAVALSIVHESVHARLDRLRPWTLGVTRRRMEVRCLREEIAFASRIPETMFPGLEVWARARWRNTAYAQFVPELSRSATE